MEKKQRKIAVGEIVGYSIAGAISVGGLVWLIFGIIADYLKPYGSNWIQKGEAAFSNWIGVELSFRFWGLIVFLIGVFIFLIVVSRFAKKADLENDKRARRAQRLIVEAEIEENMDTAANEEVDSVNPDQLP